MSPQQLAAPAPDSPDVIAEVLAGDALVFSEAAKLVPPAGGGRPCSPSTVWRWATKGVRGIKLEVCRTGVRWVTSKAALTRFIKRLSGNPTAGASAPASQPPPEPTPTPTPPKRRTRQTEVAEAEAELKRLGV